VADGRSFTGVSVLCRSEPVHLWERCLELFPSPSGDNAQQITAASDREESPVESSDEYLAVTSRIMMKGAVSPCPVLGEKGRLEQGWWCRNQLSALHLMVYLDKTADTDYRRCQAPGCGRLFRAGPNSTRIYCPYPKDPQKASICGSRVTSQRNRVRQRRKS
jgi:hypothetical protein